MIGTIQNPLAAVLFTLPFLLAEPTIAQQSQEADTQNGDQATGESAPSGGTVSAAAANTTGASGRPPDFTWTVPLEFKDLATNTASIGFSCYACTDDCDLEVAGADLDEMVSGFEHKIEFPNPAPSTHKETVTITSMAGYNFENGKQAKLPQNHLAGEAVSWICLIDSVMCRNEKGEIVDDPGQESCAAEGKGGSGQDDGKFSK